MCITHMMTSCHGNRSFRSININMIFAHVTNMITSFRRLSNATKSMGIEKKGNL